MVGVFVQTGPVWVSVMCTRIHCSGESCPVELASPPTSTSPANTVHFPHPPIRPRLVPHNTRTLQRIRPASMTRSIARLVAFRSSDSAILARLGYPPTRRTGFRLYSRGPCHDLTREVSELLVSMCRVDCGCKTQKRGWVVADRLGVPDIAGAG